MFISASFLTFSIILFRWSDDELPCMEIIIPRECTVLAIDSVSLKECSEKNPNFTNPNDELIARFGKIQEIS